MAPAYRSLATGVLNVGLVSVQTGRTGSDNDVTARRFVLSHEVRGQHDTVIDAFDIDFGAQEVRLRRDAVTAHELVSCHHLVCGEMTIHLPIRIAVLIRIQRAVQNQSEP